MLAVVDTEPLVLSANEDGGDDVANDEDCEEDVVERAVVDVVEDGEQDQAGCTSDRGNDAKNGQDLLPVGGVWGELAQMSQPPLCNEGNIESDDRGRTHCNE